MKYKIRVSSTIIGFLFSLVVLSTCDYNKIRTHELYKSDYADIYYNGDTICASNIQEFGNQVDEYMLELTDYLDIDFKPRMILMERSVADLQSEKPYSSFSYIAGLNYSNTTLIEITEPLCYCEKHIIKHEMIHMLSGMTWGAFNAPYFMVEGLAQAFCSDYQFVVDLAFDVSRSNPYLCELDNIHLLPTKMERNLNFTIDYKYTRYAAYNVGAGLIWVLYSIGGLDKLRDLYINIEANNFPKVLKEVYGMDIDELEAIWDCGEGIYDYPPS
jgi:hypothetical protein